MTRYDSIKKLPCCRLNSYDCKPDEPVDMKKFSSFILVRWLEVHKFSRLVVPF